MPAVFDIKRKKAYVAPSATTDGKAVKCSSFVVLMNTNYKPKSRAEAQEMLDSYPTILEEVANQNGSQVVRDCVFFVENITTDATGKKTFETRKMETEEFDEDIKFVKSRFEGEVGTNYRTGGRFHIHASFFIVHTSKIQMDMEPLVKAFNTRLTRLNKPIIKYFHVKSEKPSGVDYMRKNYYASQAAVVDDV